MARFRYYNIILPMHLFNIFSIIYVVMSQRFFFFSKSKDEKGNLLLTRRAACPPQINSAFTTTTSNYTYYYFMYVYNGNDSGALLTHCDVWPRNRLAFPEKGCPVWTLKWNWRRNRAACIKMLQRVALAF